MFSSILGAFGYGQQRVDDALPSVDEVPVPSIPSLPPPPTLAPPSSTPSAPKGGTQTRSMKRKLSNKELAMRAHRATKQPRAFVSKPLATSTTTSTTTPKLTLESVPLEILRDHVVSFLSIKDFGQFMTTCKWIGEINCDAVHKELATARFGRSFLDSVYSSVRAVGLSWKQKIRQQLVGNADQPTATLARTDAKLEDYGVILRWSAPDPATFHLSTSHYKGKEYFNGICIKDSQQYIATELKATPPPHVAGNIELAEPRSVSSSVLPDSFLDPSTSPLLDPSEPNKYGNKFGLTKKDLKYLRDLKAKAVAEGHKGPPSHTWQTNDNARDPQRVHLKKFLDELELKIAEHDVCLPLSLFEEVDTDEVALSFIDYASGTTVSLGKLGGDYDSLNCRELDYAFLSYGGWGEHGGEFPSVYMGADHDVIGPVVASVGLKVFYCIEDGDVKIKTVASLNLVQFTEWDVIELGGTAVANSIRLLTMLASQQN